MFRFHHVVLPLALFVVACDTPDHTESAEPNEHAVAQGERVHGRGGRMLAELDADKDGTISAAEAAGHPRIAEKFAEIDANRDGKLDRDELAAMKGRHGKGERGRGHHGKKDPAEHAAHMLAKFDADKDGSLSKAEVEGRRFADKFDTIDADRDGKLAQAELAAFKAEHHGKGEGKGWGHGGHHGKKDPAERAAHMLEKFDADRDGSLSRAEVEGRKLADKFDAIDTNRDGKLGKDELTTFKAEHRKQGREAPAAAG
jgi:Ca2+-binding EF-hand superfamily protein